MHGHDDPFHQLGTQVRDQQQMDVFKRLQQFGRQERKPFDPRIFFALFRIFQQLRTHSPTAFYLFVLPCLLFLVAALAFREGHSSNLHANAATSTGVSTAYVFGGICLAGLLASMLIASYRAMGLNRVIANLHLVVAIPSVGLVCYHYLNPAHSALRHIPSNMIWDAVFTMVGFFGVTLAHDLIRGQRYLPREME